MKHVILACNILFMYTACETGTKYEENTTIEKVKKDNSVRKLDNSILNLVEGIPSAKDLVEKSYIEGNKSITHKYDPENPLNGDTFNENYTNDNNNEDIKKEELNSNKTSFQGSNITDGLNVKSIRVGYHKSYTRLVFDIEKNGEKAKKVGVYNVDYDTQTGIIAVTLDDYRGFSAKFPTFSKKSVIENIYFNEDFDDSGFKFSIKLRDSATVKTYAYKNPARLIIDIKPF